MRLGLLAIALSVVAIVALIGHGQGRLLLVIPPVMAEVVLWIS